MYHILKYICTLSYHTFDIDTSHSYHILCMYIKMILEHMYRVIKIPLFPLFSFLISYMIFFLFVILLRNYDIYPYYTIIYTRIISLRRFQAIPYSY